jgi:hypothetical protein
MMCKENAMKKKTHIRAFAKSLAAEIPELQRRLQEYYRSDEYFRRIGFDASQSALVRLLGELLKHLEDLDEKRLKGDMVGIYRIISDDAELEKSALGKDLYAFNDRLEELIRLVNQ